MRVHAAAHSATPLWLLPPDLRNPRQWLELITEIRATFTVSPDFGYRNCVRNVRDTPGLDLASLKSALSGAEPVRLSTIEAFESHFGLKNIIPPCYGLAEATLAVAIWPRGTPLRLDPSGRFLSVGQPCRGVSGPHRAARRVDEGARTAPERRGTGRRRRDLREEPRRDARLLQQSGGHRARAHARTAGSARAIWASSTARATSSSRAGSRTS